MNFKTTLFLLVLVVIVVGAIFVFNTKAPPAAPTIAPEPLTPREVAEKKLIEDFGDAVAITVQAPDHPDWKFEREASEAAGPQAGWKMTAPTATQVTDWQVAQIANRLKELAYTVRYDKPGDGMTAEQAGLDKPRATVTLVDDRKKEVKVEIGRNEADSETYVRLGGADAIYRVRPSLKNLLKDKALAYRQQQLFVIKPESIVEIQIDERPQDGEPVTYRLVKTGADWRFTEPAPAKAVADKVRSLTSSLRTLRTTEWVADDAQDLNVYGLDPAPLTVTVVTEETPPANADTTGAAPAPTSKTYKVAFSSATPLGDETKVYVRADDDHAVGTVMKTLADRFKPDLKEWRENRLLEQDPGRARSITITAGDQATRLERVGTEWTLADNGAPADKSEARSLLDALRDAKAVNFEPGVAADPAKFGLDNPRGTIEVAFEGGETHRIAIGGYADTQTQRLVFAQVDDNDTAMKLLASDVTKLLREPSAFRDRTVASVAEDRLRGIALTQPVAGKPQSVELVNSNGAWRMTAPVDAAVDDAAVRALVALLGNFHASRLIDVPAGGDLAAYGLAEAPIELTYTYQPADVVQVDSNGATTVPAEPQKLTLRLGKHEGKVYAQRTESEGIVYEVDPAVWTALTAELRKGDLFAFDPQQVTRVTVRDGVNTQGFEQTAGKWVYIPEADIPIDGEKVKNYLVRLHDLKVARVVEYNAADLAAYGLDQPAYAVEVSVGEAALPALLISQQTDETGAHFAKSADAPHVFLLPADALDRVRIDLSEFEPKA